MNDLGFTDNQYVVWMCIKNSKEPISTPEICFRTGLNCGRVCKNVKMLLRYRYIEHAGYVEGKRAANYRAIK